MTSVVTGDTAWIAMEWVEGRSLREELGAGPQPHRRTIHVAQQVPEGLAAAVAAGIVHRDLKPENVIVRGDGLAKMVDVTSSVSATAWINSPWRRERVAIERCRWPVAQARHSTRLRGQGVRHLRERWAWGTPVVASVGTSGLTWALQGAAAVEGAAASAVVGAIIGTGVLAITTARASTGVG